MISRVTILGIEDSRNPNIYLFKYFDQQQMYNPANLMLIWNNSAEFMQDKFNFLNYLINLLILV